MRRAFWYINFADESCMDDSAKLVKLDPKGLERAARLLRSVSSPAAEAVLANLPSSHARPIRKLISAGAGLRPPKVRRAVAACPFDFLLSVSECDLIAAVQQERSQTVAVLLTAIPIEYAPRMISGLDDRRRGDVVTRLASLGTIPQQVIDDLLGGLRQKIEQISRVADSCEVQQGQGIHRAARILRACDRVTEESMIRQLEQTRPKLSAEIKRMLFDFEDIVRLNDGEVQTLAKNIQTETWALALQRCSDILRARILKNLTPRAAQQLRAEMNYLGDVLPSEIDRSQQRVVDVARQLNESRRERRCAA